MATSLMTLFLEGQVNQISSHIIIRYPLQHRHPPGMGRLRCQGVSAYLGRAVYNNHVGELQLKHECKALTMLDAFNDCGRPRSRRNHGHANARIFWLRK